MAKTEPFDRLSARYDRWFEEHDRVYDAEIEAIEALLPPFEKGVEIGVGTGRFAEPLGIEMGVEPSSKMAEYAKSRGIQVLHGVAERLPLPDRSFDLVLMVTTICFVDDPNAALREIYRILVPGGHILVGFVDKETPLGQHYLARQAQSDFYRSARFFSAEEVHELLQKTGFVECRAVQTLFGPDLEHMETSIQDGYGEGAFVVFRCQKPLHA